VEDWKGKIKADSKKQRGDVFSQIHPLGN